MVQLETNKICEKYIVDQIKSYRKNNNILNIYELQFYQLCEVKTVLEMKNKKIFDRLGINNVEIFNGRGPDIKLYRDDKTDFISIEIKGSRKKRDYFNQNKYKGKKVFFYGNSLKLKDFDVDNTGNICADFVILVACKATKKQDLNGAEFNYYILDRNDISKLKPKGSIFLPSFALRIMIDAGNSFITDEFCDLKKGVVQIICDYEIDDDSISEEELIKDFSSVWSNNFNCFLLQSESNAIVDYLFKKRNNIKNQWCKIKKDNINNHSEGAIQKKRLFKKNVCGIYNNTSINNECVKCRDFILKNGKK